MINVQLSLISLVIYKEIDALNLRSKALQDMNPSRNLANKLINERALGMTLNMSDLPRKCCHPTITFTR